MMQYKFSDSVARIWCYLDRLIMHLIYETIRLLYNLRLTVSSHKSKMCKLNSDFHFLGVNFALTRISQSKSQVDVRVHSRTPRRALDKVNALSSRRTSGAHAVIP